MRQQLDKKTKKMEKLMDTVRKQLEIKRILENKLQKAFAQAREAQGSAEALEKDYETQVKLLKETIQARNDEIASMNRYLLSSIYSCLETQIPDRHKTHASYLLLVREFRRLPQCRDRVELLARVQIDENTVVCFFYFLYSVTMTFMCHFLFFYN